MTLSIDQYRIEYDGIQEGGGIIPDAYQWTVVAGPVVKGATFYTKANTIPAVAERLAETVEAFTN